jgi:hypothetical protein
MHSGSRERDISLRGDSDLSEKRDELLSTITKILYAATLKEVLLPSCPKDVFIQNMQSMTYTAEDDYKGPSLSIIFFFPGTYIS